jgi:hypothetical protein
VPEKEKDLVIYIPVFTEDGTKDIVFTIDPNCTNKSSSAEVSKAIISIYQW